MERILAEGKLKPHPVSVESGGLESVLDGLDDMRQGNVSGEKLVYKVN